VLQQALWANLSSMLQHLLSDTLLEAEEAISMSLSMAGALADQAGTSSSTGAATETGGKTEAAASKGTSAAAGAHSSACQLLELAAQLMQYCRQQALHLAQQQAPADSPNTAAAAAVEQSPVVQHITGVQQQVLLQLGQAYLASKQYARVLECVTTLQGLSVGCSPVPGLVQLSILALIGQGKLVAAAAQLVAWLKQGSQLAAAAAAAATDLGQLGQQQQQQSTEEACTVVDAFLQALHEHASSTDVSRASAAAAGGASGFAGNSAAAAAGGVDVQQLVQQVADAAAERCQGQPGVAVAVVLRLLENEVRGLLPLTAKNVSSCTAQIQAVIECVEHQSEPPCNSRISIVWHGIVRRCMGRLWLSFCGCLKTR
jgi:hypothetical protein